MKKPYAHNEQTHNLNDPSVIVPVIYNMFGPSSVIDVGCGVGNFLSVFKDLGTTVHGVDGSWADVSRFLNGEEFSALDLTQPFHFPRKFDLAISLEVAEHLPVQAADTFVDSLAKLADVIVFSAAIPFQGGQNHLNEQWPSYWVRKFSERGFGVSTKLRETFWEDARLFTWYRQNILVFERGSQSDPVFNVVHPKMFIDLREGRDEWRVYVDMMWRCFRHQVSSRLGRLKEGSP